MTWHTQERLTFSNLSVTPATFALRGGLYYVAVNAAGSGSVTLQRLGPDGTTYITCLTAFATTSGSATVQLPQGTYKLAIATFTAVYAEIISIQQDN
jgi:hypothetical protein